MLSLVLVINTSDILAILDDLLDIRLLQDLDSVRLVLGDVFELIISFDHRLRERQAGLTFSIRA